MGLPADFVHTVSGIADRREGVVTRRELLDVGWPKSILDDARSRALLVPALRGVYLVGRRTLTSESLVRAGLAYVGEDSMVSFRTAAERRDCLRSRAGIVEISTTRPGVGRTLKTMVPLADGTPGLLMVRRTDRLDCEEVNGVLMSTVPRMIVEIASTQSPYTLERVWKQLDYRGLLDLAELDRYLEGARRRNLDRVHALLERHPDRRWEAGSISERERRVFNSPAEVDFLQLVADAGLPCPEVNAPIAVPGAKYVADFFWRHLGLIAEVDDPSHQRPLAREHDSQRELRLKAMGLDVIHFETPRLRREPSVCMTELAAVINLHRGRLAPTVG